MEFHPEIVGDSDAMTTAADMRAGLSPEPSLAEKFRSEDYAVVGCDNMIGGYLDNVPARVEFHHIDCSELDRLAPVFVSDVVGPLFRMATDPACAREIINVGPGDRFITINKLAATIASILDFELEPIRVGERPREVYLANCSADQARRSTCTGRCGGRSPTRRGPATDHAPPRLAVGVQLAGVVQRRQRMRSILANPRPPA